MRLTPEDSFARMLRMINDNLDDLQSQSQIDEVPVQIRTVAETETSTDSTTHSVDASPGWVWGTSAWGYDIWK